MKTYTHSITKTSMICFLVCMVNLLNAQYFSRQDSLRGSITSERSWWDLKHYHLEVEVLPEEKKIIGKNTITYEVLEPHQTIQIDLQRPLLIKKVVQNGETLEFTSDTNAHFITLKEPQIVGDINAIEVFYEGNPRPAFRAPWDGGFSWKTDDSGDHFIATSCQGLGASVWWPCKDHMYDEVDSMKISVEVPENLSDVSNGRLLRIEHNEKKKTKTFHWIVSNPINNYGVNLNIGNYVHWREIYEGENGPLDITYWALKEDEKVAKKHFQEVLKMLEAFEYWFGPYPFYEDGYQLVQAPYLGMEHQSSVTYGNQFKQGYLGMDLSGTGWGLKFDFIIIHESGHEWFANNITYKDIADMWVHEGFTNYSESLYLEYFYGKEAGQEYIRGVRSGIENQQPIIGPYDVNYEGYSIDVYNKGANLLNTLRTIVANDEEWRNMLRRMNYFFKHKTVTSKQIETFIANYFKLDLIGFFDQYLRDARLPTLEYYFDNEKFKFRWTNCLGYFDMPLDVQLNGKNIRIKPTVDWSSVSTIGEMISFDQNYYCAQIKIR